MDTSKLMVVYYNLMYNHKDANFILHSNTKRTQSTHEANFNLCKEWLQEFHLAEMKHTYLFFLPDRLFFESTTK